jgi:hypothetical protein
VDPAALPRIQVHIGIDVRIHVSVRAAITAVELPLVRCLSGGARTAARLAVDVLADAATLALTHVGAIAARPPVDVGTDTTALALMRVGTGAAPRSLNSLPTRPCSRSPWPLVARFPFARPLSVRVDAVVPHRVHLVAVPENVVRIYPRFRRDRVVIIEDEVVIVDPVTLRIIAVLPA